MPHRLLPLWFVPPFSFYLQLKSLTMAFQQVGASITSGAVFQSGSATKSIAATSSGARSSTITEAPTTTKSGGSIESSLKSGVSSIVIMVLEIMALVLWLWRDCLGLRWQLCYDTSAVHRRYTRVSVYLVIAL